MAHLAKLRAALKPFAAVKPSFLYPEDGSEQEGYRIYLAGDKGPIEFTGLDLALAREAYEYIPPAGVAYIDQLEFFTAILLACSLHRAQSLEVLEDFIRNLKSNAKTLR
jgi:hypothetical protein